MARIVGIDLGTTNSVVAYLEGGEPRVITNEEGGRLTASVVGFAENGEVLVGEIARRQAVMNPANTVYSVKRFMGRRFAEVEDEARNVSYDVIERDNGDVGVKTNDRIYSPPEISARILQKLKRAAELHLGETVTEAVITVPAYFNDAQRKATRDAGEIAGLTVRRIINEPTAAALCYGLDRKKDEIIAVYDLGGGTFDISILEVGDDVVEVLATNGDTFLGGDNIDQKIVEYLLANFQETHDMDVSGDRMVMQRLREAAERAKKELSSIVETEINLPFLTANETGPKHLNLKITRAELENLVGELIQSSIEPCRKALADANRTTTDIDEVILVGGMTRMPLVQRLVSEFFGKEPHRGVNPDEVVALGAAVQGAVLSGDLDNVLLLDVVPLSLGLQTTGGVMTNVIDRNTTIPTRRTKMFSTVSDNQTTIEVVVFQGERKFAKDNRCLGRFELSNIPKGPRATPQIEVTFDVDANGIVTVSAVEKRSEQKAEITIKEAGGLTQDEIRRAVQDAAASAADDETRRKQVETRNHIEGLMWSIQRQLRELDVPPDVEEEADNVLVDARALDFASEDQTEQIEAVAAQLIEVSKRLVDLQHQAQAAANAEASEDAESADAEGADAEGANAGGPGAEGADATGDEGAEPGSNGNDEPDETEH